MSALKILLDTFRHAAVTEREKGTYFEELIVAYLRNEATYKDYYSQVWTFSEWAKSQGLDGRDTGIDLVAETAATKELHAIQCKFYDEDYKIQKKDLDSFFTASGKRPFTHRIVVTTSNNWSEHANDSLQGQQTPCNKIDLQALEESQIDWASYQPKSVVTDQAQEDATRSSDSRAQGCHRRAKHRRSWQAHYGLWHRQNLHQSENCRSGCRQGQARALSRTKPVSAVANPY